jgi:hypothetical protein
VAIVSCLAVSFHGRLGDALGPDRPGRFRRNVGDPNLQINIIECDLPQRRPANVNW